MQFESSKHVSIRITPNNLNFKDELDAQLVKKNVLQPSQERIRKNLKESIKRISKHRRVYVEKSYEHDMDADTDDDDIQTAVEQDDIVIDNEEDNIVSVIPNEQDDDDLCDSTNIVVEQSNDIDESSYGLDKDVKTDVDDNDSESDLDADDSKTDCTGDIMYNDNEDESMDLDGEYKPEVVSIRMMLHNHSFKDRFNFYKPLLQKQMDFGDCSQIGI